MLLESISYRSQAEAEIAPTIDVSHIQSQITEARNCLLSDWKSEGRVVRSFEPEFDRVCYVAIEKYRDRAPEAYNEAKKQLDDYTRMNLITAVGERLNTELSAWEYDIREDGMYGQGTGERAIEMYKRGRDFRRQHGKAVDFAREDAEIVGIYKIDEEIAASQVKDSETGNKTSTIPDGTKWVSFSHRGDVKNGSIYTHNFCDVLTFKSDGEREYVEANRFAISSDPSESFEKIKKLFPERYGEEMEPTAEFFLSHPIRISSDDLRFKTAEDFHSFIQNGSESTLSKKQFELVLRRIKPAIDGYLQHLSDNPHDKMGQLGDLRGVFNAADATVDMINGKSGGSQLPLQEMMPLMPYQLDTYKNQQVEEKLVGCGFSGDYGGSPETNPMSAFSVVDFGKRAEDDPNLCKCGGEKAHFHCPGKKEGKDCNNKIIVGKGITQCPECGEGKRC